MALSSALPRIKELEVSLASFEDKQQKKEFELNKSKGMLANNVEAIKELLAVVEIKELAHQALVVVVKKLKNKFLDRDIALEKEKDMYRSNIRMTVEVKCNMTGRCTFWAYRNSTGRKWKWLRKLERIKSLILRMMSG